MHLAADYIHPTPRGGKCRIRISKVRRRIRDMLADENRELSLASLVQAQRVVLDDTVKLLDRNKGGDDGPPPMTAEELEELLARTTPNQTPEE